MNAPANRRYRSAATQTATQAVLLPPHVYRRRRVMAVVALVGALAAGFFSTTTADATSTSVKPKLSYVTVYSGESMWQIAERVAPETDPRDFIDALMQANNLTSVNVNAGQRLILPGN